MQPQIYRSALGTVSIEEDKARTDTAAVRSRDAPCQEDGGQEGEADDGGGVENSGAPPAFSQAVLPCHTKSIHGIVSLKWHGPAMLAGNYKSLYTYMWYA